MFYQKRVNNFKKEEVEKYWERLNFMNKIVEKLNKFSLPATILMASIILGGFYYASQVYKQKSIERQQQLEIEQEKQAQATKKLKEKKAKEEAEQALDACMAEAEEQYSDAWYRECKSRGKLTSRCISLKEMTFEEYSDENPPPADLLKKGLDDPELKKFIAQ